MTIKTNAVWLCLALVAGVAAAAPAQVQQQAAIEPSLLDNFAWRSVGPPGAGGRIVDVEVVGRFPHTIFVAGATGGLWRSTNNGVTFEPIFDDESTNSIGDIAIHPSNPDIIWVGTGEANARNSVSWGDGVYKTTDGGKSWSNVGLRDSHHIGRVIVDPTEPDTVYVAALGHFWGPNEERGVYKTTDGGGSWERVLFIDADTGFVDLAMDPRDPGTLYAAAYQVRRDGFSGGDPGTMHGPGSGIYKSADGGRTWKELTLGLPTSDKGRIGLAVSVTDPEVVYAIVQTATTVPPRRDPDAPPPPAPPKTMEDGGVFRSTDRGETWEYRNSINPRPFYYSQIRVDPTDAGRVYVLGGSIAVSDDAGETFENLSINIHVDHHDLWIDPDDADHLVVGNDGGVYFSYDRGATWDFVNQMALGQFYAIDVDMREPYYIYGGVQDYMSWAGPSATRNSIGITEFDWYTVMTGDGFQVRIDPDDHNIVYAEAQYGRIIRHDQRSGQNTSISPEAPDGEKGYRFNWDTPLHISSHGSETIYASGNHVFRSPDRGDNWQRISPDLTTATTSSPDYRDGEPQKVGSVSAFAESPLDPDLLYAGTDDGNVWVTRDGGAEWIDLTEHFPGLTGKRWVSRLIASRFDERRAYASFDGHRNDDFAPHIYISLNAGETWESIAANLPDDGPVRVIREDIENPDLLFLGTEFAAYVSFDRGGNWLRLMNNMPTVAIADLAVHPTQGDLIAGTHGRSAWVMDITPLRELTAEIAVLDLHVFAVEDTTAFRYRVHTTDQFLGEKRFVADNPPYGATISYLVGTALAAGDVGGGRGRRDVGGEPGGASGGGRGDQAGGDADTGGAKITITTADGALVRELEGPASAGIHRLQWDLRHTAPESGGGGRGGGRGGGGGSGGPLARPGIYQVSVAVGGREQATTIVVRPDPALQVSDEESEHRWQLLEQLLPLQAELADAARLWRELREALESVEESAAQADAFDADLRAALDALLTDTRRWAFEQGRTNGSLSGLYRAVESSPFAPTGTQLRVLDEVIAAHGEQVRAYEAMVGTRVPAFETQMRDKGVPRVVLRRSGR